MINHPTPETDSSQRAVDAKIRRIKAADFNDGYLEPENFGNPGEQELGGERYPVNFTKALKHNKYGMLKTASHYEALVDLINQNLSTDFSSLTKGLGSVKSQRVNNEPITWRGWESPRTGHFFSLQGADSDKVGMDPPPELGSEELMVEIAEVYALALLRDIPFKAFDGSTSSTSHAIPCTSTSVAELLESLIELQWYGTESMVLGRQASRRRAARKARYSAGSHDIYLPTDTTMLNPADLFRGSSPGCKTGPYVSQFLVNGTRVTPSNGQLLDSEIHYGAQVVDQRIRTLPPNEDYMVHWCAYLDVQNGANFGADSNEAFDRSPPTATNRGRRFIATPRDLASYVKVDALYQAYLNACLFMLSKGFAFQQPVTHTDGSVGTGFPDKNPADFRQGFASFGGPHILSLVTEVSTRCLKAVRRQKYNYHRRARPERIGGLLTLHANLSSAGNRTGLGPQTKISLDEMAGTTTPTNPNSIGDILDIVKEFNEAILDGTCSSVADPHLQPEENPAWLDASENCLLPMAYAEGSPLHPSYGAGHATVAGGCVTILKAFFDTVDTSGSLPTAKPWPSGVTLFEADASGDELLEITVPGLTIEGELNKLAANISIARNMGGVHFYSDYYDSVRMGERIATSILLEQMYHYDEPVEIDFRSFDNDHVHIQKLDSGSADPIITIRRPNQAGQYVDESFENWWCRHVKDVDGSTSTFAQNGSTSTTGGPTNNGSNKSNITREVKSNDSLVANTAASDAADVLAKEMVLELSNRLRRMAGNNDEDEAV